MARATGLGGVFIKARDPEALAEWYKVHLGVPYEKGQGAMFRWADDPQKDGGVSVFTTFPETTKYFAPSTSSFMLNFRVDDLAALVVKLKSEGVQVDKAEDSEFGGFAWLVDPEGNKIELWEPPPESESKL